MLHKVIEVQDKKKNMKKEQRKEIATHISKMADFL